MPAGMHYPGHLRCKRQARLFDDCQRVHVGSQQKIRSRAAGVEIGGEPLDRDEVYTIVTNNFLAGGADGASLDLSGITINLRVTQENEQMLESGKTFGYHHIGINVDDIDAKFEDLKAKGYAFAVPPKDIDDTLRIAFFDGPENVTIELLQMK